MLTLLYVLLMAQTAELSAEEKGRRLAQRAEVDPSGVVDVVSLAESDLRESSGLAVSRRRGAHFWSHNDSGGRARLYAFDSSGRKTGQIKLTSVRSSDWEDMASFIDDGVPRLLVADCGDNDRNRNSITFYLFDEPDPTKSVSIGNHQLQRITIVYPDGPRDCEAVAVDPQRRQIIFIAKSFLPACGVYIVPLPGRQIGSRSAVARRVGTLPMPMVTAMDLDQGNGDIWVVSYFQAFRFQCTGRQMKISDQIGQIPRDRELPRWRQIEAFAVDAAHDLWVTSEGSPAPLGRLPHDLNRVPTALER